MAEDTPEVAALKAQEAKLKAEKAVMDAEREKLEAARTLARAQADADSSAAQAAATLQTTLANAAKAKSQAEVEAINAEVAAAKAKMGVGLIPGTNLTGSVTVNSSAGNFESSLLAARALKGAAETIKTSIGTPADGKRYILFTGVTRPSFADLLVFETKVKIIENAYAGADNAHAAANKAYGALANAPPVAAVTAGPATESVVATAAAAGAALDTLSKLGSYFQSDYSVYSATVTGADSDLLAVSLAGVLTDPWYPGRWPPPQPSGGLQAMLGKLPAARQASSDKIEQVLAQQKTLTEAASKAQGARKAELERVAALYGAAATAFSTANKANDDLLVSLAEADAAGVARVTRLLEQKSIHAELAGGALALVVNVAGAGGTNYTKKNLWTFFGTMPFYVSGGAIASYLVFDKDGVVKKAGQLPLHSGFRKVHDVPDKTPSGAAKPAA